MAKISIGQFKELHPTMRTYIIRRYMVAGFLLLLISSIGIFTKSVMMLTMSVLVRMNMVVLSRVEITLNMLSSYCFMSSARKMKVFVMLSV